MAYHQYIGARYVPKFYENSAGTAEWRSGVIYEPLTIVTWNGNSYTSKKMVPSVIGDPSLNPDYWVATGLFNQQVADLSDRLITAESNIDVLNNKTGYYTPEMFGAAGDGVTDDYQAFVDMLAAMPEGAIAILTAKKYIVSKQLEVTKNLLRFTGITSGEYSPQIATTITSGALFHVTSSGCSFTGLNLTGPARGTTTACAIDFDGSLVGANCDSLVENVYIFRFEYGIRAGGRNVWVRNCIFSAPRYGVVWYQLAIAAEHRGHIVECCRFHGVPTAVLNEINNTLHVKNLTIKNNILDGESAVLFNGFSGGLTIKNNVVYIIPTTAGAGNVILINEHADTDFTERDVVEGNVLHIAGKQFAGIGINGAVNALIRGNYVESTARRGIYTSGAAKVIIAENVIDGATSWAIECAAASAGAIVNNIIANSASAVAPGGATETGTVTVS